MIFLGLGLGDLLGGMGSVVTSFLKWFLFWIVRFIYPFIIHLYNLFELLVKGRLLDNDIMQELSGRVGLILGLIMFFIVIISAIQMLVDPDKANDKEKGAASIITRVIIVIIMFGISSFAFNFLYYVQEVVVESHVIGKFFVPTESDNSNDNFGAYLSYQLFVSFYRIYPEVANSSNSDVVKCKKFIESDLKDDVYEDNSFASASRCLSKTIPESSPGLGEIILGGLTFGLIGIDDVEIIEFDGFLAVGAGIFCIYFLLSYCITVGVRMIQLAMLEIMSPMAFVSYLSPKKDNMFNKWLKLYFSTYVDSFIRIAIISFAVYLVNLILGEMSGDSAFFNTIMNDDMVKNSWAGKGFITVIMIIAILSFAKKAPDLIKDLFPAGASKLGLGTKGSGVGALFAGAAGLGIAGIGAAASLPGAFKKTREEFNEAKGFRGKAGAVGKALRGAVGATGRMALGGVRAGYAGFSKDGLEAIKVGQQLQSKANLDRAQRIASGTSYGEYLKSNLKKIVGIETGFAQDEREIKLLSDYAGLQSTIEGYADNNSSIKRLKRDYEAIQQSGRLRGETDEHYTRRIEAARKKYVTARDTFITEAMSNPNALTAGTLTFEYDDQNSATGKSSATFTIDAAKDGTNIESICAVRDQLNTMLKNNPSIFKGYNNVVNSQTSMDSNTIKANNDIAKRKSTQRQKFGS